jgi:hypothetical protein
VIATVRIAPVEHWCEVSKGYALRRMPCAEVGLQVEIITTTMHKGEPGAQEDCDGRFWDLTRESATRLRQAIGFPDPGANDIFTLCEHMLEMD